jgi:hypothetical protein
MPIHSSRAERVRYSLGTPRLYREELEEIARILYQECEHNLYIEFRDERGRIAGKPEDFAEYAQLDGTPEILKFLILVGQRGRTTMYVSFSPSGADLVVENPDNSARGAAMQIREICRENRRLMGPLARAGLLAASLAAVVLLSIAASVVQQYGEWRQEAVILWALVIVIGPGGVLLISLGKSQAGVRTGACLLVNAPRSERPSWWERHRRDATALAIGGVIGYLVNQLPAMWSVLGSLPGMGGG